MCACLPTFILSLLSGNPRTRQMRENCYSKKPSPLRTAKFNMPKRYSLFGSSCPQSNGQKSILILYYL